MPKQNDDLSTVGAALDRLIDAVRLHRDQSFELSHDSFDAAPEKLLLVKANIAVKH
jgi:hypothetical protein